MSNNKKNRGNGYDKNTNDSKITEAASFNNSHWPDKGKAGTKFNAPSKSGRGSRRMAEVDGRHSGHVTGASGNDPAWYNADPNLTKSACDINYRVPLGVSVPSPCPNDTGFGIPGIMTIQWIPAFGISEDNASTINVIARKDYTFVRHFNSGRANYFSADMLITMLGIEQAYILYADMVRAYGLINYYSVDNRYTGKFLIEALGYDYDDLTADLAGFREVINLLAAKLGALPLPKSMYMLDRHFWMAGTIWKDRNDARTQMYAYKPVMLFKYSETTSDQGGELLPVKIHEANALLKVSDARSLATEIVSALMTSEDVGIICGDILKAFGSENCHRVSSVDENFKIEPQYSEEVGSQIENLECWAGIDILNCKYYQDADTGAILSQFPLLPEANKFPVVNHLINFHYADPSPIETMVATRLKACISANGKIESVGTEIVTGVTVWTLFLETADGPTLYPIPFPTYIDQDDITLQTLISIMSFSYAFRWRPALYVFAALAGDDVRDYTATGLAAQFENYAVVSSDQIKRMHEVALMSELAWHSTNF